MYDKQLIVPLILVFIAIVTFPVWYNVACGTGEGMPELTVGTDETECIEPTAYMRTSHMSLLNQWREAVVRDGYRYYVSSSGGKIEMSLTKTCLKCHSKSSEFCDRCHDYLAVEPYCWECHITTESM